MKNVFSLEQLSNVNSPLLFISPSIKRTDECYMNFMGVDYVKRSGDGPFLSGPTYYNYIKKVLERRRRSDWQLHKMRRDEVVSLIKEFNKFDPPKITKKELNDWNCALMSYLDFIDFCEGRYISKRLRAAA